MRMFFAENKKVIALCVIPIAAIVAFIGYQVIYAHSNHSDPNVVNEKMRALLEQNVNQNVNQNVKQTATPSPTVGAVPEVTELPIEFVQPDAGSKPKKTAKPERTAKPKAASKPRATARPKQTQSPDFKININKAMTEELIKLPGIGESKAKAIITYRDAHHFQTLDELMKVKGIGPKIFEKIKEHVEL